MNIYCTLLLSLIISSFIQAQIFEIKLFVNDSQNLNPISNANVDFNGERLGTTGNSGMIVFQNIPSGNYKIKITHIAYNEFQQNIFIKTDTTIYLMLSSASILLNEVFVTAGKYEREINLLPYSVISIDDQKIKNNPSITISDLLKNESGVSLLRDGIWGTDINIRGLNRANIVTLVDGNRIETSTDISARLSMFDLNDVERIEVIKGAASSLYGSGATGGTINIISKSGSYTDKFTLDANYSGTYNSVNNYFSNGITILATGTDWITKLTGSYRKAQNTQTPSGELFNSQFEDYSFSGLFQARPFTDHEIKINYQQFRANDVGIPGAAPLFPNKAVVTYPEEKRRLINAEYKINNLSDFFVKFTTKYFNQYIVREVENIPGIVQFVPGSNGQPPRRISVLKISPGADHNVNGLQSQADFTFSNHYFIAGLDYWTRNYEGLRSRDQKIEILNPADSSVTRTIMKTTYEKPIPNSDFNSAGIYLQDDMKLLDKLNITLGGRYDYIWLSNEETINPLYEINDGILNETPPGQEVIWEADKAYNKSYVFNLGFVYSLSDNSNIALNTSKSFRSPSLEERYQYIDLGSVIRVGNPDLSPEQGYFIDLGFRIFPTYLKFSSSIFYNSLKDLVTEIPGTYDGRNALIKTNIGKARLYGFEYSIQYLLSEKISVYNNLSYVRGENLSDNTDLPQIPPLNFIIGFNYSPVNWLTTDISATIFDAQNKVAPGESVTPGYSTFNFGFIFDGFRIGKISLGIKTGIENLLDKDYRNHLSSNRGLIVSEPGRNYYLKADVSF